MAKKRKKFYVVWDGVTPGIYPDWASCQAQIKGYPGAKYKSYSNKAEAEEAYLGGPEISSRAKKAPSTISLDFEDEIIWNSISVDAACSGNPGKMEYQGVDTRDKTQFFHQQFELGTNNIGEFLAIVHALAMFKQQGIDKPIYTDSVIARKWVYGKRCKTTLDKNSKTEKLYRVIHRAETWLKNNTFTTEILKWETKKWGEIPADFGRK